MKKKHLLFAILVVLMLCTFTILASAAEVTVSDADFVGGVRYKSTINEFGTVNNVIDTSTVYYYNSTLDTTSRMVLKNADGSYSTYPTLYVMYTVTDSQGPRWGFEKINELTGETYDVLSVVRIEFPEGTNHVRGSSFKNSTNLVYVEIASTIREIKGNAFQGCSNLAKIEFRLDFEKYPEFGSNVKSINNGAVFNNCTSLTELVLPNSVTEVNTGAISGCTNLKLFNPGASFTKTNNQPIGAPTESFILPDTYQGNCMLFSYDRISKPNRPTTLVFYYTGTFAQAQNLQEIETQCYEIKYGTLVSYDEFTSETFERDSSLHYFVYGYNHCDAFYDGNHNMGEINSCLEDATCQREKCGLAVKSTFTKHNLNKSLVYANGFDNEGVYSCNCNNAAYCTVANATEKTAPIVTFLGYSVPETAGVKGINAGFKVEKDLLEDYNDINDVDATLTLFMVNCKSDEVNISKIFKDGTLDLETGVKGINVAITSTSYTNISVEVRGFDDSSVTGNYYTLKLITAIAVKTEEGTHFVQAGLEAGSDKQAVDGVDFNIVSAENVYSAVAE